MLDKGPLSESIEPPLNYYLFINLLIYYIHFEIIGDPWNLIGSQQCDLSTNSHYQFALNCIFFPANEKGSLKQHNQTHFKSCL